MEPTNVAEEAVVEAPVSKPVPEVEVDPNSKIPGLEVTWAQADEAEWSKDFIQGKGKHGSFDE